MLLGWILRKEFTGDYLRMKKGTGNIQHFVLAEHSTKKREEEEEEEKEKEKKKKNNNKGAEQQEE